MAKIYECQDLHHVVSWDLVCPKDLALQKSWADSDIQWTWCCKSKNKNVRSWSVYSFIQGWTAYCKKEGHWQWLLYPVKERWKIPSDPLRSHLDKDYLWGMSRSCHWPFLFAILTFASWAMFLQGKSHRADRYIVQESKVINSRDQVADKNLKSKKWGPHYQ